MVKIAPSLVSAPMTHLAEMVKNLERAGADYLHFDIEDGAFVPEMSLGIKIIRELRALTDLPFDVHLMINDPEWLIPRLADYGADMVSVHYEACAYPRRTLGIIHQHGMKAGLALNPKTPLPELSHYLPFLSYVLILTTEPETVSCTYLPSILKKVEEGKKQKSMQSVIWEVDGGFTSENIQDAVKAGADIVVSGRGVFRDNKYFENIKKMKEA